MTRLASYRHNHLRAPQSIAHCANKRLLLQSCALPAMSYEAGSRLI